MHIIDSIMSHEPAKWVNQQIERLPNRAKFRASNAIQSLNWANSIDAIDLPIPACFCALHATEEAVAAFISCAKECNYVEAREINIKDHRSKATVSLLTQKVMDIFANYDLGIACDTERDQIVAKFMANGKFQYSVASCKLFYFGNDGNISTDFYDFILKDFGDIQELKKEVSKLQNARNKTFYADSKGSPTGFLDPIQALRRECHITLGLIWAAIDINRHKGELLPFITQALKTANLVSKEHTK